MPSPRPTVTVAIPVFNSLATLQRAIRSVQQQSLRDFEIILVDDASTDLSLNLAREIAAADARIRIIDLLENQGKSYAMNQAIAVAAGHWIAVLDADDWYEPDRLAIMVAAGERFDVPIVADNQYFHDGTAEVLVRSAFSPDLGDRPLTRKTLIEWSDPYADFNYGMLKPLVRADLIQRSGVAYRESARLSEDFFYLVELLATNAIGLVLARPLYNWTQSFGSISRQWTTTGAGRWRYDFQAALKGNAEVMEHLRDKQEHELADLLVTREKAFKRLHQMSELSQSRSVGATLPHILGLAVRRPAVWPLLTRRVLRAAGVLKRV